MIHRVAGRCGPWAWRAILVVFGVGVACVHADWPQFRGPAGDGHAPPGRYPTVWSEGEHVKWKTPIHGKGWSSPVVRGGGIWVTTATEDGRELSVLCVDAKSGRVVLDRKLFEVANPQFCHKFNSYASPTPVVEGGRVYVTFGSPGTACVEARTGRVIWERRDLACNHYRGAGSSPILVGDMLILQHDGSDHQYVVALDKRTGRTVWNAARSIDFKDLGADGKPEAEGDFRKAFATPHLIRAGGRSQLVTIGARATYGLDPRTGVELWRMEERTAHSASTRPVFADGVLYYPTGFSKGQLLAVVPGGRGEVVDANAEEGVGGAGEGLRLLWKAKRNVPNKPSLVWADGLLFMVDDGGIASCLEAATGAEVWRERVGGNYSASPLYAGGHVYFFSEEGKTTVVAAGREFRVVARNELGDGFMASPAVDGGALILRSRTHLYRVERD